MLAKMTVLDACSPSVPLVSIFETTVAREGGAGVRNAGVGGGACGTEAPVPVPVPVDGSTATTTVSGVDALSTETPSADVSVAGVMLCKVLDADAAPAGSAKARDVMTSIDPAVMLRVISDGLIPPGRDAARLFLNCSALNVSRVAATTKLMVTTVTYVFPGVVGGNGGG